MAKVSAGIPQGTRDFSPAVLRKRQYIIGVIRGMFELFGFEPLETPAMENLETLTGKYGEEGDKLIFKILNNGLGDPRNIEKSKAAFENALSGKNDKNLTERALRYDLTIPFARYVSMNYSQLSFPFKRYQIQPVWRADRPQKGRYREFYQCDADIVGSNSLLNEVELAGIYTSVFEKLGVPVEIKINNRKILSALADICGGPEKLTDITVAIDKLDKIGLDGVTRELESRGLLPEQVALILQYLQIGGSSKEKLRSVEKLMKGNASASEGIEQLLYVLSKTNTKSEKSNISVDLTLARGLNYYTGIIFEVKATGVQMGSIGGGGRYNDLTGLFGVPDIPGVGISFGLDRIYDVMEELKLFPETVQTGTQVLFFNLGEKESDRAYEMVQALRRTGIASELFHEQAKFDKQFKYAEKKLIPFIVIIGSKELEEGTMVIKKLSTGQQEIIRAADIVAFDFKK